MIKLPQNSWNSFFIEMKELGLFDSMTSYILKAKSQGKSIFPPSPQIFRAFDLCDVKDTRIVLLGQDPYHDSNQANGLCFSVNPEIPNPPSLRNILKEIKMSYPEFNLNRSSDLSDWSEQGVLLINSVLTVEKDLAGSHSQIGWQIITDKAIEYISGQQDFVVFILLGNFAKSKIPLIDTAKHVIITAAHPSPLSAHRGFIGSQVFLKANMALQERGFVPIQW